MAELTQEQQQLLGIAATRMNAVQQPVGLTPEQISILESAKQRLAGGNRPTTSAADNPLAMPDFVNQQPDAATTAALIDQARQRHASAGDTPYDPAATISKFRTDLGGAQPDQVAQPTAAKQLTPAQVYAKTAVDKMDRAYQPGTMDDAANSAVVRGIPFGDEITGTLMTPVQAARDWYNGEGLDLPRAFDRSLAVQREEQARRDQRSPIASTVGSMLGGAATIGATSKASLLAKAQPTMASMIPRAAADGAIISSIYGAGEGENLTDRAKNAIKSAILGAGIGALTPPVVAGVTGAVKSAIRPVEALFRPEKYTQEALAAYMRRAGMTPADISQSLANAQADNQGMYTVADSMGHTGRRALSAVTRTPNDARQEVVDQLLSRQGMQGDRLSNFLAEGFDAPDTAAQRLASLKATRTANANTNYTAARNSAGTVDPTDAIRAADDFLTPGAQKVMSPLNNIADDSVEGAVRRARSYLTDGNSILTDFNAALRAKQELDNMIEGAKPTVQRQLIPMRDKLDDALASSSAPYAAARDQFRKDSLAMDAVDKGVTAASARSRAADNIPQFQAMTPDQQAAFRAGYVDPSITRIEAASISPTTNKARMLMTEKTGQEFPAFATPGKADQLGDRVAREQRMFETSNAALGGSKTADNLADMADMSQFDPEVMSRLFRGDFLGAAAQGVKKGLNFGQGMPPRVVERIGRALMTTDPAAAQTLLAPAQAGRMSKEAIKRLISSALIGEVPDPLRRQVWP